MATLDEELQMLLADMRRIKGGCKTLRFALNHDGADVRLSIGYLAALASAKCGIELAVISAEVRAEIAGRKKAKPFEPFA